MQTEARWVHESKPPPANMFVGLAQLTLGSAPSSSSATPSSSPAWDPSHYSIDIITNCLVFVLAFVSLFGVLVYFAAIPFLCSLCLGGLFVAWSFAGCVPNVTETTRQKAKTICPHFGHPLPHDHQHTILLSSIINNWTKCDSESRLGQKQCVLQLTDDEMLETFPTTKPQTQVLSFGQSKFEWC